MGLFHCPLGAPYYDDDACIDCGLCYAKTSEERVEASRKIREYMKAHAPRTSVLSKVAVCGKGGSGKTTVVALLAMALKQSGRRVIVIDADESNPGLGVTYLAKMGCSQSESGFPWTISRRGLCRLWTVYGLCRWERYSTPSRAAPAQWRNRLAR
ncbi:MAG: AAA family ATPase [Chloroflexi bacterium]|nr:AAA family ATPase [Chloroflexota bacterium]